MLGTLFLLLTLACGYSFVRLLPLKISLVEFAALSITSGLLLTSWTILLVVLLLGYQFGLPIGCLVVVVASLLSRKYWCLQIKTTKPRLEWIIVTVLTSWFFCYLHWTHDLLPINGQLYSVGYTWADIALHLTLASSFASATHFSWQFPLFHGSHLTYPFLLDFTSSLFYRFGWDWHWSFLVPSVLLDLAIVQLLYSMAVRLSGKRLSGPLGVLLFLLGGSAAGWVYAWQDFRATGFRLSFFSHLPFDYSYLASANLDFTNVVTAQFLPQRAFALGLAVVLSCLLLLKANQPIRRRTYFLSSLLIGLLPLAHLQSYEVGLALLLGVLLITKRWQYLLVGLPGFCVAALQLLWQVRNTATGGFIHFYIGWMRAEQQSLLQFWYLNFGLLVPLMLIVYWLSFRSGSRFKQGIALLSGSLFLICNTLILQPNAYDNTKQLLYWYLFLCLLLAEWFARYLIALPLVLLISLPGILAISYDQGRLFPEVNGGQISWAAQVQKVVPEGQTILTSQQHNNPVSMLSGRPIVLGYPGWLWTYGIDYGQTLKDVGTIYAGSSEAVALIRQYHIQYIETGPEESAQFLVNQVFFQQFPVKATSVDGTLYYVGSNT